MLHVVPHLVFNCLFAVYVLSRCTAGLWSLVTEHNRLLQSCVGQLNNDLKANKAL